MSIQKSPKLQAALVIAATFLFVLTASFPAAAQEPERDGPPRTVLKATKYVDVREVEHILSLLEIEFAVKPDQNVIVMRGASHFVENAIKVVDVLDEPRPSFELQVFVLAASKENSGAAGISKDLEAAVSQLSGVFGYRGFEVLDTVFLQVMEGRKGQIDGGIRLGGGLERTGYHFSFEKVHLVPEENRIRVRIDGLSFYLNGTGDGSPRARLRTDVEFLEGQKAVIGSSTPEGLGETLVLIVEARVLGKSPWE